MELSLITMVGAVHQLVKVLSHIAQGGHRLNVFWVGTILSPKP